jgi:hypothetical protein
VSEPFPSPTIPADSRTEVFLRYLDFFRTRSASGAHPEAHPEPLTRLLRSALLYRGA